MPSSIVKVVYKPAEKKATAPMENPKAGKKFPKDASSIDNKNLRRRKPQHQWRILRQRKSFQRMHPQSTTRREAIRVLKPARFTCSTF